MIFDYMYKTSSAGDPGTLYQLKWKLNRKDVNEKVTKAFHGCESFFSTVLDGYVVYADMEYFGMASPDDSPLKICLGEVQKEVRKLEKWSIGLFSLRFSQKQSCWKMHYKIKVTKARHVTDVGIQAVTKGMSKRKGATIMRLMFME